MAEASAVLDAEAVAIYRLHEEEELLTIQTAQGLEPGYVAAARIPCGPVCHRTGRAGTPAGDSSGRRRVIP